MRENRTASRRDVVLYPGSGPPATGLYIPLTSQQRPEVPVDFAPPATRTGHPSGPRRSESREGIGLPARHLFGPGLAPGGQQLSEHARTLRKDRPVVRAIMRSPRRPLRGPCSSSPPATPPLPGGGPRRSAHTCSRSAPLDPLGTSGSGFSPGALPFNRHGASPQGVSRALYSRSEGWSPGTPRGGPPFSGVSRALSACYERLATSRTARATRANHWAPVLSVPGSRHPPSGPRSPFDKEESPHIYI